MTHALLFHLLSFLIIAGGAIGSLTVYFALRRAVQSAPAQVPGLVSMVPRFGIMAQVGVLLMILSGVGLMSSRGWVDWGQTWLTIKLLLVVLLSLNGELVAKRLGKKMGKALAANPGPPANSPEVNDSIRKLGLFYCVQIPGLLLIISLAVLGPR